MGKKVLIIVGLAAAIAIASTGVYSYISSGNNRTEQTTPASAETIPDDDASTDDDVSDAVEPTEAQANEAPQPTATQAPTSDSPHQDEIVSGTFYIQQVYDHTSDEYVSPRVVFGSSSGYCYVSFEQDNSFEIMLDPASDDVRHGTYSAVGDRIEVSYDNGTASEYTIVTGDDGGVLYIIVNYGDYDVYFG